MKEIIKELEFNLLITKHKFLKINKIKEKNDSQNKNKENFHHYKAIVSLTKKKQNKSF